MLAVPPLTPPPPALVYDAATGVGAVRVFDYHPAVDAFTVSAVYGAIADWLGLTEWHPAVWIGRLLAMDEDYGEHLWDNWDEREARTAAAEALRLDANDLLIVVPARHVAGRDGPSHSDTLRAHFWRDALRGLVLSTPTLEQAAAESGRSEADDGECWEPALLATRVERLHVWLAGGAEGPLVP